MEFNKTYILIGVIVIVVVLGVIVGVTVWLCRRKKVEWEIDEERETLLAKSSTTNQYPPRLGVKSATLNSRSDDEVLLAQMYIRSSFVSFKHPEVFPSEHRADKNFFIVESLKEKSLMTMVPLGKNSPLNTELNRTSIFKLLKAIDHPFIWKTIEADYHKEKNVIVLFRPLALKGSIKDMMYGRNKKQMKPPSPQLPKRHTLGQIQKKQKPKEDTVVIGKPLTEEKIAKWGRQVLEGIQYLRVHKFPYYNLHCGNVLLDEQGNACITDHESQLVGSQMVYPYRDIVDFYTQKGFDGDVILFGSFLFEISFGYIMDSPILHDFDYPADCPKSIKKLLQMIFPKDAPSEPLTIKQLTQDPFFASVTLYTDWKTHPIPMDARAKGILEAFKPVFGDKPVPLTKQASTNSAPTSPATLPKSTSNMSLSSVASAENNNNGTPTMKKKKKKKANTLASQAGAPAPKAPPPPTGAPPPPPPPAVTPSSSGSRKGLLSSIEGFDAKKLKKAKTVDKSKPKFK